MTLKIPRRLHEAFPDVQSIKDSRRPITATVTSKDCDNGKTLDPSECALAKAVKRQYKANGAIIGVAYSYIITGKKAIRFKTPATVAREIVSFDRNRDFAPGNYGLSPVSPTCRLGHYKRSPHPSGKGKIHRIIHKQTVRVRELRGK